MLGMLIANLILLRSKRGKSIRNKLQTHQDKSKMKMKIWMRHLDHSEKVEHQQLEKRIRWCWCHILHVTLKSTSIKMNR